MSEISPTGTPSTPPLGEGGGGPDVSGLLQARFSTLGQMRDAMIQHLGEKEGKKLYNDVLQTIGRALLAQVQQSASDAQKAARKMRGDGG